MVQVQRGNQREYFENQMPYNDNGANFELASQALNNGVAIIQQANVTKLANDQADFSNKMQEINTKLNIKYENDPHNPEREKEYNEAFNNLKDSYEVNPFVRKQWNDALNKVNNNFKSYNTDWAIKQEKVNINRNLQSGYQKLIQQMGMMGQNGSSLEQARLAYANGMSALRTGATSAYQNPEITEMFLKDSTHDCMAMFMDGLIEKDPATALNLLNNPESGVANDLNNTETISKLKKQAQSMLLKQNEIQAVDRVASYITNNAELYGKALNGTLTAAEAQSILTDKNVDRTMRAVLSGMLGYSAGSDLSVDLETGKIENKSEKSMTGEEAANFAAYSTLTIGDKQWSFATNKGKLRRPTQQEQEEIRSELYIRGSQLLNGVDNGTPQQQIRKIAEFQAQVAQASYFGLNQGDYNKLMNDFVLPATKNIQADAQKFNANISSWNPASGKYGWEQINNYFDDFAKNLEDTAGNRKMIDTEKALASVYYWGNLNNYCSQKGININDLYGLSREERASIYNKAAKSAIEKAKATSSAPQLWFRSANPQYVSAIRSMLPNSNANNVITNVAVASMSNPTMSDKDMQIIINREVQNEYAKMRTANKNVAFGNNSNKYDELINLYSMQNGVDPLLVKCIIRQESGFNSNARSSAGAGGLMQLMPKTARGLGCKNVYDPKQNIAAGTLYIGNLLRKYNGNTALALAAYNAGSGAVQKYGNKVPPYRETQNYVNSILKQYRSIKG